MSLYFGGLCRSYVNKFLYTKHCHGDHGVTLVSQMINFLCLIHSKQLGSGLFYQHIQLLQHQVSRYS